MERKVAKLKLLSREMAKENAKSHLAIAKCRKESRKWLQNSAQWKFTPPLTGLSHPHSGICMPNTHGLAAQSWAASASRPDPKAAGEVNCALKTADDSKAKESFGRNSAILHCFASNFAIFFHSSRCARPASQLCASIRDRTVSILRFASSIMRSNALKVANSRG